MNTWSLQNYEEGAASGFVISAVPVPPEIDNGKGKMQGENRVPDGRRIVLKLWKLKLSFPAYKVQVVTK